MARHLVRTALVVVSCALPLAAAAGPAPATRSPRLLIAMTSDCAGDSTAWTTARKEASRVWDRAGLDLRWVGVSELPYTSHRSGWLVVNCGGANAAGPPTKSGALPIAAIRFIGAQPMNTIVVSVDNARTLLAGDSPDLRELNNRFAYLKETRLGRMLGRAIAHEVGHFLSGSVAHTPSGLMRATHSVTLLTGFSLEAFDVQLHAMTAVPIS